MKMFAEDQILTTPPTSNLPPLGRSNIQLVLTIMCNNEKAVSYTHLTLPTILLV